MEPGQYKIIFTELAITHLRFWHQSGNKKVQKRIEQLVESISQTPAAGIGKPEMLKYELAGKFSRRINQEHRIIYEVRGSDIIILSLKGHY